MVEETALMGKDILKKKNIIFQNFSYHKNLRAFSLVILIPGSKELTRDVGYATRNQMTIYTCSSKARGPFRKSGNISGSPFPKARIIFQK